VPDGHFVTARDCSECHGTIKWDPDTFMHSMSGNYPGDHAGNFDCRRCHAGNSEAVRWTGVGFDCAGCHASTFNNRPHRNRETGQLYSVTELQDCTMACHVEDDGRAEHRVGAREW
jgi:hypothetical protein